MTSPYAAGGGGTHLEARVAASYLGAILCEASIRGLPGEFATCVKSQRAAFGDPLDDLIIDGTGSDGRSTQLHLQVTNRLSFTESDAKWIDVLQRAWVTFSRIGFDSAAQRVGVGLGTYNARVDQHYQSVLNWALYSTDAQHFLERIAQGDYSHQDKRSFVSTVRVVLAGYTGATLTDDELWRFLKSFVIVHFDFQSTTSSRDEASVIDRLRGLLPPDRRDQAKALWDHLVSKAGEMIPAGGGATRATLIDATGRDGIQVGAAPSHWKDIQALRRESRRALDDIKSQMHGLRIHRAKAYQKARDALSDGGRFVQLNGEPGTGKSVLLKAIAEECERAGPVLVLKDTRINPRGWAAHAHVLGVSDDVVALLREFACSGEPILFIDGIDKITDPFVQITVNDILKAIANDDKLSAWRVLVTIREQNLKHLETWLDPDALKKLPLRTISVAPLGEEELELVAEAFPRLRPLLTQSGGPDVILKRAFFVNALLGFSGSAAAEQLPATEVELLKLWWELGGADRKDFANAQHRRNALVAIADAIAQAPNTPVLIRELPPEPLEELKSAGVIRDKELGHSVVFTHDIYEEWSLCELLISKQSNVAAFLKSVAEPDALIRPVQLLGAYVLETSAAPDSWKALLESVADETLRPVWQRTILTSCLQSTRATQLLQRLPDYLLENDSERLRKLLRALVTIEVLPNPLFLNEQLVPDLSSEDRAKFAHLTARPKALTWVRFLDWLMPQMGSLNPSLIPDLLPLFKTWQDAFAGQRVRHCRKIGELSYTWLMEVEEAWHPKSWKDHRDPFDGALSGRDEEDVEKNIRALFLSSAGDVPGLASEYLCGRANDDERAHMFRDEILKNYGALARHVPAELVDFILKTFLEDPEKKRDRHGGISDYVFERFGISADQAFYPASPVQPPFLGLLRLHEQQGLRLVRTLCNHSIAVWRKAHALGRCGSDPLTPVPVSLTFPWGTQAFWGDGQVYLWFRGAWGNDAVESALMALEQWALEQIESGTEFDETFRKVIEGNDSVGALGIGVSLCLANPTACLQSALPLVTCPYLWGWDINRSMEDSSQHNSNEIGSWHLNRAEFSAVRALNQKPHRKEDIRDLVPHILLSGDKALIDAFADSVRSFPDRLPISYEEERSNSEHLEKMCERMVLFAEQADPQHFRASSTPDGAKIQVWNEPPSLQKEQYQEQQRQHLQLNAYIGLAMWARKSLEEQNVDVRCSLDYAFAKAQEWDTPDLFDCPTESLDDKYHATAVAGAAAIIARHCSVGVWTHEIGAWCLDVVERAATAPEKSQGLLVRSAMVSMGPAIFAAHGYAALLARGYEVERCQHGLLNLALDGLSAVQEAVFSSGTYYASTYPEFYWILLSVTLHECIVGSNEIPDSHSIVWDEREAKRKLALLECAERHLASGGAPTLPHVPPPWIKLDGPPRRELAGTDGYSRNDTVFLSHNARQIFPHIFLEPILADARRKDAFLAFVGELLAWTFQEMSPPFAGSKRDRSGRTPYEWVYAFSAWCGKLCVYLTPSEAKSVVLVPIWAQHEKTTLLMLQSVMRSFMIEAFLKPSEFSDEQVSLWSEMAEWLFANKQWRFGSKGDHLDREFTSCAFSTLFCAAPDFSPLICGVDPGWPHLRRFLPVVQRAICEFGTNVTLYLAVTTFLKRGGIDLLPDPALTWLHGLVVARKADQKFWQANGDDTVELLKLMIGQRARLLTFEHRKKITLIADILVDNGVRGAGFLQQELLRAN